MKEFLYSQQNLREYWCFRNITIQLQLTLFVSNIKRMNNKNDHNHTGIEMSFLRNSLHGKVSKWQILVQPVTKISSK